MTDQTGNAVPEAIAWEEIEPRIQSAVRQLQKADAFLLRNEANERTISHRLAMYLDCEFPGWDVDVEYNRAGTEGDSKRIADWEQVDWKEIAGDADPKQLVHDMEARTVYPDIIVHRRGTEANLLVIELKKSGRPGDLDRRKLHVMGDRAGLGYQHAVFLQLPVGDHSANAVVPERVA